MLVRTVPDATESGSRRSRPGERAVGCTYRVRHPGPAVRAPRRCVGDGGAWFSVTAPPRSNARPAGCARHAKSLRVHWMHVPRPAVAGRDERETSRRGVTREPGSGCPFCDALGWEPAGPDPDGWYRGGCTNDEGGPDPGPPSVCGASRVSRGSSQATSRRTTPTDQQNHHLVPSVIGRVGCWRIDRLFALADSFQILLGEIDSQLDE